MRLNTKSKLKNIEGRICDFGTLLGVHAHVRACCVLRRWTCLQNKHALRLPYFSVLLTIRSLVKLLSYILLRGEVERLKIKHGYNGGRKEVD